MAGTRLTGLRPASPASFELSSSLRSLLETPAPTAWGPFCCWRLLPPSLPGFGPPPGRLRWAPTADDFTGRGPLAAAGTLTYAHGRWTAAGGRNAHR